MTALPILAAPIQDIPRGQGDNSPVTESLQGSGGSKGGLGGPWSPDF